MSQASTKRGEAMVDVFNLRRVRCPQERRRGAAAKCTSVRPGIYLRLLFCLCLLNLGEWRVMVCVVERERESAPVFFPRLKNRKRASSNSQRRARARIYTPEKHSYQVIHLVSVGGQGHSSTQRARASEKKRGASHTAQSSHPQAAPHRGVLYTRPAQRNYGETTINFIQIVNGPI